MGAISASQALEVSACAMYHDTTCSPSWAISTTRSRDSQIPSTKSTRWASPVGSGMGQTRQNSAVLLLNVRPCPGIESWVSFDMSHARNSSSLAAVSSYETVVDAPHARHLPLWDPAPVLPFLFIAAPQEGHLTAFISSSLEIGNLTA